MHDFQKLNNPQLVELEGEYGFIIATDVDVSEIRNGLMFMQGESYNYDDGELTNQGKRKVQYSLNEDANVPKFAIDDNA